MHTYLEFSVLLLEVIIFITVALRKLIDVDVVIVNFFNDLKQRQKDLMSLEQVLLINVFFSLTCWQQSMYSSTPPPPILPLLSILTLSIYPTADWWPTEIFLQWQTYTILGLSLYFHRSSPMTDLYRTGVIPMFPQICVPPGTHYTLCTTTTRVSVRVRVTQTYCKIRLGGSQTWGNIYMLQ